MVGPRYLSAYLITLLSVLQDIHQSPPYNSRESKGMDLQTFMSWFVVQGAIVGALVAFVYFYIVHFWWAVSKLRHIKGPLAIPLWGNLYDPRALSVCLPCTKRAISASRYSHHAAL